MELCRLFWWMQPYVVYLGRPVLGRPAEKRRLYLYEHPFLMRKLVPETGAAPPHVQAPRRGFFRTTRRKGFSSTR